MKLFITTAFILGLSVLSLDAISQTEADYAALEDFMSPEQIQDMQSNQPLQYQQMAYLNRHAYHISQMGTKELGDLPSVFEVTKRHDNLPDITLELIESQELNLVGYEFEYSYDKYHYYKIDDNGTVLSIAPLSVLFKKANLEIE